MANNNQKMMKQDVFDVIIAGGGLAGLISAIELSKSGLNVMLIEKKSYPFHKVCGEYVSNEVKPYLKRLGVDFEQLAPSTINKLRVSTLDGNKNIYSPLTMGGFGISRYKFDNHLFELLNKEKAVVLTNTRVKSIDYQDNIFTVKLDNNNIILSKIVIGSYGKRDMLDKQLSRDFINSKTGYMGVKYHIKTNYPENEIGLDNFKEGYCGISKIEEDKYCLCYLSKRSNMDEYKTLKQMEEQVLYKNSILKSVFKNSDFLFEKPEVINEISFAAKAPVVNHILMCGDTAGMITPLCGNGMAMAIHSSKILSEYIISAQIKSDKIISSEKRNYIEKSYAQKWNLIFVRRIYWGRKLQYFAGKPLFTNALLGMAAHLPKLKKRMINLTHGETIH